MFAASRAVAEVDLQAAYRIACGAPRPMAVARRIIELLKKLHRIPEPGDHLPEGQTPCGPPKRGVPKHNVIPIAVDMSTLETVLGDLNLRSAAGPTGWTYRLIREFWDLGDRDDFKHATLKIVGLIAQGSVGLDNPDGERGGESAFSYLSRACRLAALPKPDGSPRPIAVGDAFYRIAAQTHRPRAHQ